MWKYRTTLLVIAIATGVAWLALRGSHSPALPSGPEQPVVNVYNWTDYIGPHTLQEFQKQTGIKVNYDVYSSSEIVDTKLMAGHSGYDVVIHAASFVARLIPVGIVKKLDKSKIPNWKYLDPKLLNLFSRFDPGMQYGAPYMWGTVGFAYNVDMIKKRMKNPPVNSAALVFDPKVVSHFADCGVSLLDSPTDVIPLALLYLGRNPNSIKPKDLHDVQTMLLNIRPYIKYFSSEKMLNDLPNKEVCIANSWSGDYMTAWRRAKEAGIKIKLAYDMPKEGMPIWLDAMYIPSDAPHPENALKFINFILRPKVIAAITNTTAYANAEWAATRYVKKAYRDNPAIYPDKSVMKLLKPTVMLPPKLQRERTRVWTRVKTGL